MIQSEYLIRPPPARALHIIRAAHLGMCFGVRDAIALARAQDRSPPLTILGDLAHNETVLAGLRAHGIRMENRVEAVATPAVMITAHGASDKTLQALAGARPAGAGSDLSAGALRSSRCQDTGPGELSPCHHRPARPCGSARIDRGPGGI